MFYAYIAERGYILGEGKIVDASIAEAPIQRNTRDENDKIKAGEGEDLWDYKWQKKVHKDVDARWVTKNDVNYYGYKLHIKVDSKSKLIDKYVITSANVHDSQALKDLLDKKDKGQELYADSAYVG